MNINNEVSDSERESVDEECSEERRGSDAEDEDIEEDDDIKNISSVAREPYSGLYLEGSDPLTKLMVARKLFRIKTFDSDTQMATVGLDQVIVNPSMDRSVAEIMLIFSMIRNTIIGLDDEDITNIVSDSEGWDCSIGVAGSAALLLLETILKRDDNRPYGMFNRWSEHQPRWSCSDVDLFVIGDDDFDELVTRFEAELSSIARRIGHPIQNQREVIYPESAHSIYKRIIYYSFRGIQCDLSIVERDNGRDMRGLINGFDISVCKVIYNPFTGLVHARLATFWDVWLGHAHVAEEKTHFNGDPSTFEAGRICSTIARMVKYWHRGYKIYKCNVHPDGEEEEDLPEYPGV